MIHSFRRCRSLIRGAALLLLAGFLASCRATPKLPDLGGLYNRAAQHHGPEVNAVIVVPGILGSHLEDPKTGRPVWGAFGGDYADPTVAEDLRLIALPMREGAPLAELRDDVVPAGVLSRLDVRIFGLPIELQAYVEILRTLGAGGYRDRDVGLRSIDYGDEHFTYFQFAYDWRRDNVENVRRLHEFILERKAYVREQLRRRFGVDRKDIKFDIIAHSMGGLLTRYYLLYGAADLPADGSLPPVTWAGSEHVERAILVGTPSAGSVEAVVQLVRGIQFSRLFPRYPATLLGTFPSIYQLFPRARHGALADPGRPGVNVDPFDPALWREMGWGLASADGDAVLKALLPEATTREERLRIALDHQRKCLNRARQLAAALDQPSTPPEGVELFLFAGDAVPTAKTAEIRRNRSGADGDVEVTERGPGDGTVLRSSALLDERAGGDWSPRLVSPIRWRRTQFLFTDHLGLTRDQSFADNVLYALLEERRD